MATTTNYGWTTPDDTALVKDGASAIRTLGTAIDSTVFTNAGNAIAKTVVDAKGDIIAATAADTVSRLAVGANDTVLTADSSTATGLKWALPASGGMTLLSTTTLSGSSTTISSINQTYTNLLIIVNSAVFSASKLRIQANGSSTLNSTSGWDNRNATGYGAVTGVLHAIDAGDINATLLLYNYAGTSYYKSGLSTAGDNTNGSMSVGSYLYRSTTAISSIVITNNAAATFTSGQVLIYGVK